MVSFRLAGAVMYWVALLSLPDTTWAQSATASSTLVQSTIVQPAGGTFVWNDSAGAWAFGTENPVTLRAGRAIRVVEKNGTRRGEIAEIAPDRLIAIVDGHRREIPAAAVARIEKSDTLRNGALIGLLVGAAFAASRFNGCEINCYPQFFPILAGIGAGVGTLVDAMKRTPTIYLVP